MEAAPTDAREPRTISAESLEPLRSSRRLSDRIAERVLDVILAHGLQPGDRLPTERELSEYFGVSRTVIREAARALIAKGILESAAGSGMRVARLGPAPATEAMALYLRVNDQIDFERVFELRLMIEIEMAAFAAERATRDEIERLHAVWRRMTEVSGVDALSEADIAFHRTIAELAHNELLLVILDSIQEPLLAVRRPSMRRDGGKPAIRAHRAILDAVASGDAAASRAAMRAHLEEGYQVWRAFQREEESRRVAAPGAKPKARRRKAGKAGGNG